MNRDLEETLAELGPGYRELVTRMKVACDGAGAVPSADRAMPSPMPLPAVIANRTTPNQTISNQTTIPSLSSRTVAFLVAASVAVAVAVAAVFIPVRPRWENATFVRAGLAHPAITGQSANQSRPALAVYTIAYGGHGSAEELMRTQRPDGSWGNDFLTRQNAAALRGIADASVAYRRAVRYLRTKGLEPLTEEEMRLRVLLATRRPS